MHWSKGDFKTSFSKFSQHIFLTAVLPLTGGWGVGREKCQNFHFKWTLYALSVSERFTILLASEWSLRSCSIKTILPSRYLDQYSKPLTMEIFFYKISIST
jgi:hypothetical protein